MSICYSVRAAATISIVSASEHSVSTATSSIQFVCLFVFPVSAQQLPSSHQFGTLIADQQSRSHSIINSTANSNSLQHSAIVNSAIKQQGRSSTSNSNREQLEKEETVEALS
jgi:hypothetical protein